MTPVEEARGSSVATNKTCGRCQAAGRAARFPCLLFYTTVYAEFTVVIEECRVAGCNFKDVIAVSVAAIRDTAKELKKARESEARLRFYAKRNLVGGFMASVLVLIAATLFIAHVW